MALQKLPTSGLDDVNQRRRRVETLNNVLDFTFDDSRVRTPAEIAAGVTPVNYAFGILNVFRYGAKGDGVTNDAPSFQAAIDVARFSGGEVLVPPPPVAFLIEAALDLTQSTADTLKRGFTIRGIGHNMAATYNAPARPDIVFKHTGHAFDCTGRQSLIFENLAITTDTVTYPETCFLLARNASGGGNIHRFRNVRVYGLFSEAVVYAYGAEDDQYDGCQFFNDATDNGAKIIQWTANNIKSLSSTFITIATGPQSTIDHKVFGGEFRLQSSAALSDVFDLENVSSVKIIGPWARSAHDGVGDGRSIVHVDLTNGPSNLVTLFGITGEHATNKQNYGVVFDNVAHTPSYWTIDSCTFPNAGAMIAAGSNVTLDDFHIRALSNQGVGGGIDIDGTLQNSHIDELGNNVSINVSTNNVLNVPIGNLTVTTRSGDFWAPTGSQTWTPGLGAVTTAGAGSTTNATVHYHGREVTVEAIFQGYTTFSIAAGGAITGLPMAIQIGAGDVTVMDLTTPALIGKGKVSGTSIIMPNTVGGANQVGIRATYFVAT